MSIRQRASYLLPTPVRSRLREIRDDRRSIKEHLDVYGPAHGLDLSYIELLRKAPVSTLRDPEALAALLPTLGLNDERVGEFPPSLHQYAGKGLRYWQYPCQFSPYLIELSRHNVRSYVEIGTRHGGTFIVTLEYLRRFQPITWAFGIDIQPAEGLNSYTADEPALHTAVMSSRARRFHSTLKRHSPIDLILIDGDHGEAAVRADFETVREHARLIAFHDIVNQLVPGVGIVWRKVVERYADEFEFHEFTRQYPEVVERYGHPLLGIGLAVRRPGHPAASV